MKWQHHSKPCCERHYLQTLASLRFSAIISIWYSYQLIRLSPVLRSSVFLRSLSRLWTSGADGSPSAGPGSSSPSGVPASIPVLIPMPLPEHFRQPCSRLMGARSRPVRRLSSRRQTIYSAGECLSSPTQIRRFSKRFSTIESRIKNSNSQETLTNVHSDRPASN